MSLWADPGGRRSPFAGVAKGSAHLDAVEQVKEWTRSRFGLSEDDTVLLVEGQQSLPGCPPETYVAFWPTDGERRQFRVFKPVVEVTQEDIPPAWFSDALRHTPIQCSCCA